MGNKFWQKICREDKRNFSIDTIFAMSLKEFYEYAKEKNLKFDMITFFVVARPEVLLGAGLKYVVLNATEPEDFAKKCIDALEGRINYKVVWERFNKMNV